MRKQRWEELNYKSWESNIQLRVLLVPKGRPGSICSWLGLGDGSSLTLNYVYGWNSDMSGVAELSSPEVFMFSFSLFYSVWKPKVEKVKFTIPLNSGHHHHHHYYRHPHQGTALILFNYTLYFYTPSQLFI